MISQLTPAATLPTKDLSKARVFYEDTLGLSGTTQEDEGILYDCGQGAILVYKSEFAGTNKATAVTFTVEDAKFDAEVKALRDKGVSFLTFDVEGIKWDGDVAYMGNDMHGVWFTDPDHNILNLSTLPT